MRRGWFGLVGLAWIGLAMGARSGQARVIERIVAVINQEIILSSELEEQSRPFFAEAERETDTSARDKRKALIRHDVLERMIDDELIQQQAADLKIHVTEDDLEKAVEAVRKQNNLDQDALVAALEREGLSFAQYQRMIRRQVTAFKVKDMAIRSRVNISDSDIRAFYEQKLRGNQGEKRVRASHIFVAIPEGAPPSGVEAKRKEAAELMQKVRGGADFAEVARSVSEDPATKEDGGDLGWFGRGALPPEVEEIVFAMEPGEIRGPIHTERGFHIIKLIDRKAEEVRPFDEVKEALRAELYQRELEKQTRTWVQELRRKAHVEVRL